MQQPTEPNTESDDLKAVRVPRDTWLRLRVYVAAHPELTFGEVLRDALSHYLDSKESASVSQVAQVAQG